MAEDAISIGGVDLTDPGTYQAGMPYEAFRELRQRAPVAWHPSKDGPGFLALTGYDEVLAVSRDSATWSSQATGVFLDVPLPENAYQLSLIMLTMDPPASHGASPTGEQGLHTAPGRAAARSHRRHGSPDRRRRG